MPHFNRANALKDRSRFDDALAGYERAIALAPDFAPAHRGRAGVLETLGRGDEAKASNEKAAAIEAQAKLAAAT